MLRDPPLPVGDHQVVWPVRRDVTGVAGPTPEQARRPGWRQTSRGLYVPGSVDGDRVEQRIVEAGAIIRGYGAVSGWASLRWQGGYWFPGVRSDGTAAPVDLVTGGHALRPRDGIRISEERLSPTDLVAVDGLCVTSAVRSVCFMMRYARTLDAAVQVLDMAAYSDLVSLDEIAAYALDHPGWTGIPRCREAIVRADENSWSPMESAARSVWTDAAGLPRPLCNVPVFDVDGRHAGTPDLLDPAVGLVLEYDGALHLAGSQRARDVRRDEAYRSLGLEVLIVVASDLTNRHRLAERMIAAHDRAARLPRTPEWTLNRPAWWVSTDTVLQRRALVGLDRDRWLRLRLRTRLTHTQGIVPNV
ncbi:hypothetical protein EKO23_13035 [Nocardioides guangzhouensis]|uniref:DUF559 domain-containing protein n=1 Tax=Nocardioides guangzhouensis TaxID=2497878 RepID=A0A4Q4ZBZ1_9ACTN|nr:hypothetical protein [Nocardioides guangzhouensis]RYP85178.1 hypothetical protein EKO23_13035 [Nocardioides guangzhouensis]